MPTSNSFDTRRGLAPSPCALDFAQLLYIQQEAQSQAQTYLTLLQAQIQVALEHRGYQDVDFQLLDSPLSTQEVAGAAVLLISMRLPLDGLKSPEFKVQLPLTVTYAGKLIVQGVHVNGFNVPEPFCHPLGPDTAQVAEMLVQGFSQRYMDHLLHSAGRSPLMTLQSA
ncbi:hypothetical protein [Deinococcus hopiensis]|uniref:hypothetical protein n=1 Tax=Deinococcus hopiensis TaxID=309885 RepID=UPI0009FBDE3D|nr:hypothetical protein [Deinococcus hopiensis]